MACDFQQCGMCDQQRLRPACAYAQSDQRLCYTLEYSTSVKLLNEQHLKFLCLKGGCTGSSESTTVKMPHCWKSHVAAHLFFKACSNQSSSISDESSDARSLVYLTSVLSSSLQHRIPQTRIGNQAMAMTAPAWNKMVDPKFS